MDVVLHTGMVHAMAGLQRRKHYTVSAVFLPSFFSKYFVCGR